MLVKDQNLVKLLKSLGIECVGPSEELTTESFKGNIKIVDFSEFPNPAGKGGSLIFHGNSLELYDKIYSLLSKEPNAEHLSSREIEDAIIRFTKEVIIKKEEFKDMKKLKAKVEETLETLLKPFESWWVIAPLEGFQTDLEEIKIGKYFIKKFVNSDFSKYFSNLNPYLEKSMREEYVDKFAVFVLVDSNNPESAIDKGKKKINELLNALRAFFGTAFFTKIATPLIFASINTPGTKGQVTMGIKHKEQCHIQPENVEPLGNFLKIVQDFVEESIAPKINRRVLRSIRWLGSAVQDEVSEDKIVKYCTALETLLMPEIEGKKGEMLAYRIALLQHRLRGEMTFPDNTLGFYEKRSQIIHGDDYEKDTLIEKFALNVERLTRSTIINVCEAIKKNNLKSIGDLVKWLEQDDEKTRQVQTFLSNHCDPLLKKFVQGRQKPKSNK
jgi:hypothetical protein